MGAYAPRSQRQLPNFSTLYKSFLTKFHLPKALHSPAAAPPPARLPAVAMPPKKIWKSKTGFFGMRAKPSSNFGMEFYDEGRCFCSTYYTTDKAVRAYIGSKESMGNMQKVSNLLSCIQPECNYDYRFSILSFHFSNIPCNNH